MDIAQHMRRATHYLFAEEHNLGILNKTPIQMNLFIAFDYTIF